MRLTGYGLTQVSLFTDICSPPILPRAALLCDPCNVPVGTPSHLLGNLAEGLATLFLGMEQAHDTGLKSRWWEEGSHGNEKLKGVREAQSTVADITW